MRSNPDIETIISNAGILAAEYKHQYVTLEHLLIALIEFPKFNNLLADFGADTDGILRELYDYIDGQDHLVFVNDKLDVTPQRTHAQKEYLIEHLLKYCLVLAKKCCL